MKTRTHPMEVKIKIMLEVLTYHYMTTDVCETITNSTK